MDRAGSRIVMGLSLVTFLTGLFCSVALVNWAIGTIPVRAIFVLISLIFAIAASPQAFLKGLQETHQILIIIFACFFIGLIVSLLNQTPTLAVIRQLVEIHVQAVVGLLLSFLMLQHLGLRPVVGVFVFVWMATAGVAIAQALDVDLGWRLRSIAGNLMNDPDITRAFYDNRERAPGLSFTPVHLATQCCLFFATFFAYRVRKTNLEALFRLDGPTIFMLLAMIIVCIASGNRSPLAGFAFFGLVYFFFVAPRISTALLPVWIAPTLVLALFPEFLSNSGLRVTSFEDGSATGRWTLMTYGFLLFFDQPWGYGLLFDSTQMAHEYAQRISSFHHNNVIRHFTLHNYYLQMLNKYGIFLLALMPFLIPRRKTSLLVWMTFIPYIIHIAFHNEGPLSSDFLFWFILPVVLFAFSSADQQQAGTGTKGFNLRPFFSSPRTAL